jgi:hypothetical protein
MTQAPQPHFGWLITLLIVVATSLASCCCGEGADWSSVMGKINEAKGDDDKAEADEGGDEKAEAEEGGDEKADDEEKAEEGDVKEVEEAAADEKAEEGEAGADEGEAAAPEVGDDKAKLDLNDGKLAIDLDKRNGKALDLKPKSMTKAEEARKKAIANEKKATTGKPDPDGRRPSREALKKALRKGTKAKE